MSETEHLPRVLIVDDTPENIELLRQVLRPDYTITAALNGEKGLKIARATPHPDLILLDILMPGMDGYEVCTALKGDPETAAIPVIFITALDQTGHEAKGLELGAVDYIRKPFEPILVKARVDIHLELKRHQEHLEELVDQRTRELALTQQVTVEALANLAEYRDPETGGHIMRTQNYVRALAEHLRDHPRFRGYLDERTIDLLYRCAPLHDIGKVGVPDKILLKPGRLTPEEFEEMKRHVQLGAGALQVAEARLGNSQFLTIAREIILNHHERWDGSGYPGGLAGDEIPIAGRLMAIADVYDALISRRPYKEPFTHERAVEMIRDGRGGHFDPDLVDAFEELSERFREIAITYRDHPDDLAHLK